MFRVIKKNMLELKFTRLEENMLIMKKNIFMLEDKLEELNKIIKKQEDLKYREEKYNCFSSLVFKKNDI
jgi:hypothetical protein